MKCPKISHSSKFGSCSGLALRLSDQWLFPFLLMRAIREDAHGLVCSLLHPRPNAADQAKKHSLLYGALHLLRCYVKFAGCSTSTSIFSTCFFLSWVCLQRWLLATFMRPEMATKLPSKLWFDPFFLLFVSIRIHLYSR